MTALTRPGDRTHSACLSLSWLSRSVLPVRDPSPANSAARSSYVLCHREQCSHMFRAESLLTIRLRPFFNRISTPASPDVLGKRSVTYTSRKFLGVPCCSRLFQAKKYGRHKPCSRQNAFTVCPLRACSDTSLRHFAHAFLDRCVMPHHCHEPRAFTRWGSFSAHSFSKWLKYSSQVSSRRAD